MTEDRFLDELSAKATARYGEKRAAALRESLAKLARDMAQVSRFPLMPDDRPAFALTED